MSEFDALILQQSDRPSGESATRGVRRTFHEQYYIALLHEPLQPGIEFLLRLFFLKPVRVVRSSGNLVCVCERVDGGWWTDVICDRAGQGSCVGTRYTSK